MSGDTNIIIFSKDRGCQLDLLLRSMWRFFRYDGMIHVLRTCSSNAYRDGYDMVISHHGNRPVNWVDEGFPTRQYGGGFRAWVRQLVDPGKPYTMFLVDDNVFKEPFDPEGSARFKEFGARDDVACFSLRMHPRIVYCYTEQRDTPPPGFEAPGLWRWQGLMGDWSYPMSVDAHIFKTADIFPLIHRLPYHTPNHFEGILANNPIMKPYMMCLDRSPVMNIPVNKVQGANGNHCGTVSAAYLNGEYLSGRRIDLDPIAGFDNISAHQEMDLKLSPGNGAGE